MIMGGRVAIVHVSYCDNNQVNLAVCCQEALLTVDLLGEANLWLQVKLTGFCSMARPAILRKSVEFM